MKRIPLIRAAGALAFAEPLSGAGVQVDRLWARAGITPKVFDDPDRMIPLHSLVRFAEEAAADQSAPDLGLRVAQEAPIESLGAFGVSLRSQPTLKKAIETGIALVSAYDSGERLWTVPERDGVRLCRRVRVVDDHFRQADLFTLGLLVTLVRLVGGPDWRPAYVELQSPGELTSESEMLSDAEIATGCPVTSIVVPRELLSRPMPAFRAATGPVDRVPHRWGRSADTTAFVPSVREAISVLLDSDQASVAAVSLVAGMSVRSLQRELSAGGTSYADLVDQVRMEKAIDSLRDPGVRIIDVALSLGYSDQAHFTRAFRRWTSVSPAQYRSGAFARQATPDLSA